MELSDNIKSKLSALSEEYSSQLPERYNEIQNTFRLARISSSAEYVTNLRLVLHKLAGSGATFGFEVLSNHAKNLFCFLIIFCAGMNSLPNRNGTLLKRC